MKTPPYKPCLPYEEHLMKKAKYNNAAWRKLEDDCGLTSDYIPGQDDGEPPQGAEFE